MWVNLINAVPDFIKSVFGIVDKAVTDKDENNKLKVEILTTLAGKGAASWLAANAFSLAMLANFALVVVLSLFNRQVPNWSLIIALLWLAGPLLNTLSKDAISKIMEIYHESKHKDDDNSSSPKTGG